MAVVQRFVNTASTAGGDGTTNATTGVNRAYASLSEWEAAEQTNLVTDGDSHIVDCSGGADSTGTSVLGWTTSASNDITIRGHASSGTGKNDGSTFSASHWFGENTSEGSQWLLISEDFVTVEGLQFRDNHSSDANHSCILIQGVGASNSIQILDCRFVNIQSQATTRAINVNDADAIVEVKNCVIDWVDTFNSRGIEVKTCSTTDVYNCTVFGANVGIERDAGTVTVKNSAVASCTDDFNGTLTIDHCASEDGDGTNAVTITTTTDEWTDPTGGDFTVKNDSASIYQAGVGQGTDSEVPTNDIIGTTRAATPDIGAFELIPAGGGSAPVFYHHLQQLMRQ